MSYRLIFTDFWRDPKIVEDMSPEDRYFYLFLLTNPSTTSCGIYIVTKKQMALDLGYAAEDINRLMDRFENQYKLISYSADTRELAIKNWGKYNLSRGGKPVIDCLTSELKKVKDKSLIKYIMQNINNEAIRELYQTFYDTSAEGEPEVAPQGEPQGAPQGDNTNTNTDTYTYTNTDTYTYKNTERETVINTAIDKTIGKTIVTVIDTDTDTRGNTETCRNGDINAGTYRIGNDKSAVANITEIAENMDLQALSLSLIKEYENLTGKKGILSLPAVKIAVHHYGYDNVKKAISSALGKGKLNMPYVNGILRVWEKEGYPREGVKDGGGGNDHREDSSKFVGFRPQEPRIISAEERRWGEEQLV